MGELVFLTHLPLLRIEEEVLPFWGGALWRLPFETYDQLSLGAFTDHRQAYELTAPVFYRYQEDLDLPILQRVEQDTAGAFELKFPSHNWSILAQLGLGFVLAFHEQIAERVWVALNLAAPAASLPSPQLSATFVVSDDGPSFVIGESAAHVLRVQGDADQEYLFLAEAGAALPAATVARASSLADLVVRAQEHSELAAAISYLKAATIPSLSPSEQLTLGVVALENLLLPEARSGLGATFARRVAALLASDAGQLAALRRVGRQLYDARSASLHGGALSSAEAEELTSKAYAQQLLSASIERLARRIGQGPSLPRLRAQLDRAPKTFEGPAGPGPLDEAPAPPASWRLGRPRTSVTMGFTTDVALQAPEGTMLCWSPLVGLGIEATFDTGQFGRPVIMTLSGRELQSLEERDIVRDFAARLSLSDHLIAGLATGMALDHAEVIEEIAGQYGGVGRRTARLLRERDLGVIALRLAGFGAFHDPELLGSFVYVEGTRCRRPTVLRQTLLSAALREPGEQIRPEDGARVGPAWQLLNDYDATARHAEVDQILTMYRRVFDRQFMPAQARAQLMLGLLEALFGRFRGPKDPAQLEDLAAAVAGAGSPASAWLTRGGRAFRNAVAHGEWDFARQGDEPLDHLQEILSKALPALLRAWLDLEDRVGARPGRVLIDHLAR